MSGYADMLHARLSQALNSDPSSPLFSDDPATQRPAKNGASPGEAGPIYVESSWPVNSFSREAGLRRLGVWRSHISARVMGAVEGTSQFPLVTPGVPIGHVALVYSHLEDELGGAGDAIEALMKASGAFSQYQTAFGAIHMAFNDIMAVAHPRGHRTHPIQPAQAATLGGPPSLQVRGDAYHLPRFGRKPVAALPQASSPSLGDVVLQLQDDVATYVCRNDLRQRVRSFVREALLRLIYREDVAGIVINAHSQGAVVALDVLSQLLPFEASKIWWLVTAGSPQRKYVNLFCWEREVGALHDVGLRAPIGRNQAGEDVLPLRWVNFYDPVDPVGDPLRQPALSVQPPATHSDDATLYRWIDPMDGSLAHVAIADRKVDNVTNTHGGGLRAHNYWDNEPEFVSPVAALLRHLVQDRLRAPDPPTAPLAPPAPTLPSQP
jgi:hypothetical protein